MNQHAFPSTKRSDLPGPAAAHEPQNDYRRVSCEFTDELEHASTLKWRLRIRYFDVDRSTVKTASAVMIDDIEATHGADFLILSSGERIRLDHLINLHVD